VGRDTADRMAFADQPVIITDDQRRSAALTVARHASDAADARDLLDALGLLDALPGLRTPAA
jgi:hypothetical protein